MLFFSCSKRESKNSLSVILRNRCQHSFLHEVLIEVWVNTKSLLRLYISFRTFFSTLISAHKSNDCKKNISKHPTNKKRSNNSQVLRYYEDNHTKGKGQLNDNNSMLQLSFSKKSTQFFSPPSHPSPSYKHGVHRRTQLINQNH